MRLPAPAKIVLAFLLTAALCVAVKTVYVLHENPLLLDSAVVRVEGPRQMPAEDALVIASLRTATYGWGGSDDICHRVLLLKTDANRLASIPPAVYEPGVFGQLVGKIFGETMHMRWTLGALKPGFVTDPAQRLVPVMGLFPFRPKGNPGLVLIPAAESVDKAVANYESLLVDTGCEREGESLFAIREDIARDLIDLVCSADPEILISPDSTAAYYRAAHPQAWADSPIVLFGDSFRKRGDVTTARDLCFASKGVDPLGGS